MCTLIADNIPIHESSVLSTCITLEINLDHEKLVSAECQYRLRSCIYFLFTHSVCVLPSEGCMQDRYTASMIGDEWRVPAVFAQGPLLLVSQ